MFGLCGPSDCTQEDYFALYNTSQTLLIKSIEGVLNKTLPRTNSLTFVDPSAITVEDGSWYYLTTYICIVLIALAAIGTIYSSLKKHDDADEPGSAPMPSYYQTIETTTYQDSDVRFNNAAEESVLKRFFDSFSISKNLDALWNAKQENWQDKDLEVFKGVRAVAFFMVVVSLTFSTDSQTMKNYPSGLSIVDSPWYLLVIAGLRAIDVFFFLSGFLAAYMLISKQERLGFSIKTYLEIIYHRLLRIYPTYFIVMLIYWKLSVYLTTGPMWSLYVDNVEVCDNSWGQTMLLLQNWLAPEG
jgi:hypothetical protein